MDIAKGTFEISLGPTDTAPAEGGGVIDRFVLDKAYTGDLAAHGRGQMLASTTATDGSAGYVAMEHIEGSLAGMHGGFVVQHVGIMDRGDPNLRVQIIPDSGTGGLVGIVGTLEIEVADDGTHSYTLSYETRT